MEGGRREKSAAVINAYHHVKEFMTDAQKAHTMLRESKACVEAGDLQGAIDCTNEGINFHPSVVIFSQRAICHKMMQMWSEAYFDYSFAIRLEPENGTLYCLRGLCLARLKKVSMAQEDLDLACKLEPSANNFYARATLSADIGHLDSAVRDLTRAMADDQITLDLRLKCMYKRAAVYFDMSRYSDCVNDLKDVLRGDPNSVPPRVLLANALKMSSELKLAEEHIGHAILLDPKLPHLYIERGDIRFRMANKNKMIEAVYDFDMAIKLMDEKLAAAAAASKSTPSAPVRQQHGSHPFGSEKKSKPSSKLPKLTTDILDGADSGSESDSSLQHRLSLHSVTSARSSYSHGSRNRPETPFEGFGLADKRHQRGDVLFRRAQAKLLIDPDSETIVAEALKDAQQAVQCSPDDDDYLLVVVVCQLRLHNIAGAQEVLDKILQRAPNNEKALYHKAFCSRENGKFKDAISNLSKIIAYHDSTSKEAAIPIVRVYETRGALFHQLQAHTYALSDFGRSVALNPERAYNYYLRGDCHSKLGNYEQAIDDFNMADDKGFDDRVSLCLARGMVYRLLGRSADAAEDFRQAMEAQKGTHNEQLFMRISLVRAMCLIDIGHYDAAHRLLAKALSHVLKAELGIEEGYSSNDEMLSECSSQSPSSDPADAAGKALVLLPPKSGNMMSTMSADTKMPQPIGPGVILPPLTKQAAGAVTTSAAKGDASDIRLPMKHGNLPMTTKVAMRLQWTLRYHIALSLYMMAHYSQCIEHLEICTSTLAEYATDSDAHGATLFFLGVSQAQMGNVDLAEEAFNRALQTTWATSQPTKQSLLFFCKGKVYQSRSQHKLAIEEYSSAIRLQPSNAYAIFRRAWSYKALGMFVEAGDDFETAKQLKIGDPNFAMDYKKINKYEYMIIATEPDLVEPFQPLLPLPGML